MALAALQIAGGAVVCPRCNCADFRVYGVSHGQSSVYRYKQCRNCGHKILTATPKQERLIRSIDEKKPSDEFDFGD
jgi:transcriptional regulator NrdR family protein